MRNNEVESKKKKIPNETLLPEVGRLIREGRTVTITVRGNSMNPFLVDGRDRITLGGFEPEALQPGVAVLARDTAGRIFFHRIVFRTGDTLTMQGDGNPEQTEESSVDQVMGVLVEAIRKGKRYPAAGKVWKCYSYCWMRLKPLRKLLLALFRRICRHNPSNQPE
ncbi:S24/S26 family peptidase [Bacteroides heparinolyticus]|uniref:Peptidase S24/S26A/S26B/S26C domain-containing protein n=1 Tax=Prevotella heparinolytica TaxID=28113 RepID=A0A3P2ACE6_9BACE|nr:S24/S26 family peptidase [Bacteroides heparinolyticus]RRD93101.1 hypothetical protein EII33_01485 [Bacteroides heparinolyticus]